MINNVGIFDINGLKSWYAVHCDISKDNSKKVRKDLRVLVFSFFIYPPLISLSVVIYFLFMDARISSYIGEFMLSILVYSFVPCLVIGVTVFGAYFFEKNRLKRRIRNKELKLLNLDDIVVLKKISTHLIDSMDLNHVKFRFWSSRSNTYLPSVEQYKDEIYIVLPMNYFILLVTDETAAGALLAHEFGHVLQDDVKLWRFNYLFSKISKDIIYPISIVFLILSFFSNAMIMTNGGFLHSGPLFIMFGIARVSYKSIGKASDSRKNSEELADTAAIIYSNGWKLYEVLSRYLYDSDEDLTHPVKNDRLYQLLTKLESIDGKKIEFTA